MSIARNVTSDVDSIKEPASAYEALKTRLRLRIRRARRIREESARIQAQLSGPPNCKQVS